MKKEVQLPENLIKRLQELPESGMGYQIVNFKMQNGKSLDNVTVLNCSIALIEETVDASQITGAELSGES